MDEIIAKGLCDSSLTRHVKSLEVDNDFLKTMKASMQEARDSGRKSHAMTKGHSPVYWRCRQNTMKRVTSLPHFDSILKQYDAVRNNNDSITEIDVYAE